MGQAGKEYISFDLNRLSTEKRRAGLDNLRRPFSSGWDGLPAGEILAARTPARCLSTAGALRAGHLRPAQEFP